MKQYSMRYESDELCCGSYDHEYAAASTVRTAKGYISHCRKKQAQYHPRNFRIYDHWADVDPETGYVPCVYREP